MSGGRVGRLKNKGDWQMEYNYRYLEKDAVPAIMNDATFHGGATNSKGHFLSLKYAIFKNAFLGVNDLHSSNVNDNSKAQKLQLDFDLKF